MAERQPDSLLSDDLAVAAWEDTAIVWMNYHPPRNLELDEERQDLIQVLSNWTDRDPAEIQPYWPQIREEVLVAQGIFGVRQRTTPPAVSPRPPSDECDK